MQITKTQEIGRLRKLGEQNRQEPSPHYILCPYTDELNKLHFQADFSQAVSSTPLIQKERPLELKNRTFSKIFDLSRYGHLFDWEIEMII